MFKRFIKIQNLTRFENPTCSSYEFLKWNIIFGENGRGKSTLTSIFRSVANSNPNYLLSRKTLGQPDSPIVELQFNKSSGTIIAKFDGENWDISPQNILIFDSEFIDNNIFIGGKVDYIQKRGLYEVFVGKQTGTLIEKIAKEDEAIRNINPLIQKTKALIGGSKKSDLTVDDFISLKKIDSASDPIPRLERQLENIQHKTNVMQGQLQQKIIFVSPDFSKLDTLLKTSIKTLSAAVRATVQTHIQSIRELDAERWIERGHQFCSLTNGKCPYCNQSLEPSAIIRHYEEYFNKEYTNTIKALHYYHKELQKALNIASLLPISRIISENEKIFIYWQSLMINELVETEFDIDELQGTLSQLMTLVDDLVKQKLEDPLNPVELPKQLSDTIDQLEEQLKQIQKYNDGILLNNKLFEEFKIQLLKTDNAVEVKHDLYLAYDQKNRHTTAVDKICNEYLELQNQKNTHEKTKAQFRKELDNSSVQILEQHQIAINGCLKKSGASFTIQRIDQDHLGGKPNSTFVLEINGEEIKADANDDTAPNVKTALSSGDKTTLAFAFFVSCVVQESQLSETILVIDDPISSLDDGRRTHTLRTIFDLFSRSEQGILLSHDPDFLHGIWSKLGVFPTDRASFQIKRDGRASKIEKWDVEKQSESKQKARILRLQNFIDNGLMEGETLDKIITIIRPTLEHAYKAVYPKEFPSADSLGTFIGNVKASNEPYLVNIKTRIERLSAINDYIMPYSSHDPGNTIPEINDAELLTNIKEALELLRS